jgi:hypothetical protein
MASSPNRLAIFAALRCAASEQVISELCSIRLSTAAGVQAGSPKNVLKDMRQAAWKLF